MNKIPTAEEFLLDFELGNTGKVDIEDAKEALIEFTKLHVQAALQSASTFADTYKMEQSILNAYPDELIK